MSLSSNQGVPGAEKGLLRAFDRAEKVGSRSRWSQSTLCGPLFLQKASTRACHSLPVRSLPKNGGQGVPTRHPQPPRGTACQDTSLGFPLHGACLPCSPGPPGEQALLLRSWPESCSRGGLSPHGRALHSPHRLLVGLHSARRQRCRGVPAPNPNPLPVSWGNLVMTLDRSPGYRNQSDRDA